MRMKGLNSSWQGFCSGKNRLIVCEVSETRWKRQDNLAHDLVVRVDTTKVLNVLLKKEQLIDEARDCFL